MKRSWLGVALALSALVGCGLPGAGPGLDRASRPDLIAAYQQVRPGTLEGDARRLELLKALSEANDPEADRFVVQELAPQSPEAVLPAPAQAPARLALWSEFLPLPAVQRLLPELKAAGVAVFVAVTPERAAEEAFFSLMAEGRRLGVEVRPWILLSPADGYWANKWNAAQVRRQVQQVVTTLAARGLKPDTVTLDVEPPVSLTKPLSEHLGKVRLLSARKLLVESSRNGSLRQARETYRQLVSDLHGQGVRVHAVTSPMVLDDLAVGKQRLQSALGVPIQDVPWDEVSFMAYRPEFTAMAGRMGPDIVRRYAKDAVRFFGPTAGLDIGAVGTPAFAAPTAGYTDPAEIQADLNAARSAGIGRVQIFSLDGILEQGGLVRWLAPAEAKPIKPEAKALLVRALIQAVTRSLPPGE